MRSTRSLLSGAMFTLAFAVSATAQPAPAAGSPGRAERLLAATRSGHEAEVPCTALDDELGSDLIDLGGRVRAESFERATTAFRLAERAARCSGSSALLGRALNAAGDMLMQRGLLDEASAAAQEAMQIHERLSDTAGLAQSWNVMANVRWGRGDMTGALGAQQKSLELRIAAGDRSGEAISYNNLGNVYKALGRFDEAMAYQQRALRIFDELGDRRRAGVVTDNIAVALFGRGEYTSALDYARRALATHQQLGDRPLIGKDFDTLGNIYKALGAYGAALRSFEKALRIRTAVDAREGVMETLHNIGLVHFAQGDYQLAIAAYARGLRVNRAMHDQWFSAEALRNIGAAAWRLGQRERAAADFRESLAIARRSGNRPVEAELLNDLGEMAFARGRGSEASRLFDRALDMRQAMGDEAGITESMTSLATARLAARTPAAALDLASRAAANAIDHDQPELLWRPRTVEGLAHRALGETGLARRSFTEAVAAIERLSAEVVDRESLRQRFFEDKLSPYHELIALAMHERSFGEALDWAERSRARALSELLRGNRVDEDRVLTVAEREKLSRLRGALFSFNRQIDGDPESPSSERQAPPGLERARHAAREALAAYDASVAARHPELAALRGDVKPFALADAGAIVRDARTAVLEFVVTDGRLFSLLVTRGPAGVVVDGRSVEIAATALARLAGRFRDQIASRDQAFKTTAKDLYAVLLAPFDSALAGKAHLVVVPDGPLWNVPFQALAAPDGYVIETRGVSYAPSVTALRDIEKLPKPPGPENVLAVARSEFGGGATAAFEPLPEADAQVDAIREIYGTGRSQMLRGGDATESQVKAAAGRHSVLHVATHGVLDEASPLYSYLLLAPDPGTPEDDGRLEAWEIMRMQLTADVVVLAACDTGRGRVAPGEGVVGMMWALFAAGARSMVVSQFPVESRSASTLMIAFHRHLAAGGASKWADLRRAALGVLHTPRFAHPYYWAGFILVGDPD